MNGSYAGNDPIGKLVHDFKSEKSADMFYEELSKGVKHFKETEGGRKANNFNRDRGEIKMNKTNHLPLYGVGPVIVWGQFVFTAISILLTCILDLKVPTIDVINLLFKAIGILLIAYGLYLDISAKLKSKIFKSVAENKLITDGVYGIVRNPVYSGALLACTGAVLIANNPILLIVPVICWLYMTLFLINTEEKWLKELYGQEYVSYCQKVNRCIPWFPKKVKTWHTVSW